MDHPEPPRGVAVPPKWRRIRAPLRAAGLGVAALLLTALPIRPSSAEPAAAPGDAPLRAWHFAEGNSRNEFATYFSLLNLTDQPASVMAYYNRDDGIRLVQWLGVEPRARISFNANEIVGPRAFGASFFSDRDVVVERSTTWGPQQNAETTVGFAPNDKRAWYFAEGTTRSGVSTYFVTQNLTDEPANVRGTFTRDDGSRVQRAFSVPPRGRDAYRMDDLLRDTAFAAAFIADQDIVVERTIMSEGPTGILGGPGYAPAGPEVGYRQWDFAEGSTRRPYTTYFVLFNPDREPANVTLRFTLAGGDAIPRSLRLPGLGRVAFDPRDAVPATDFGTAITSDRPIIAERSYYSSGDGLYGALGYTAGPARDSSRAWYFAEGNTIGQVQTFFLVSNLSDQPAQVQATYFGDDGRPREQTISVAARGRASVRANDIIPNQEFAARFLADQDVLVERTFYFPGWSGFTVVGAGVGRSP